MANKKIGSVERFAVGDWRYFVGYCSYCKRKHFLTKDEAKFFAEEVSIFCGVRKNNFGIFLKKIKIPKIKITIEKQNEFQELIDPVPIDIVQHSKKRVGERNFDNRYKEKGGVQWFKENIDLTLREIAEHYGFSINYAKRVRDSLTGGSNMLESL
jgi:hypothetical protein